MLSRARFSFVPLLAMISVVGCRSAQKSLSAGANANSSASANPAIRTASSAPRPATTVNANLALPSGPRLAILAGTGVGPIRFGATTETIERLMEAPCEVKTADKCRYIQRGIEFELKDGVVNRMLIHRHDRPAGPDAQGRPQVYGFFNGGIPPYLGLGMVPAALIKELGPPQRAEQVTTRNDFDTVERDTYPGMVLEYDRYTNGNVILGGVILTKADVNPTPAIHNGAPPASASGHLAASSKKK